MKSLRKRVAPSLVNRDMNRHIYADNAATTKLCQEAFDAMIPWLKEEYGNASQPYSFARKPKKALAEARKTIASCLNADPEEIFFTSGGTESDNWVIKGSAFDDTAKRLTITSAIEHHAILHSCAAIESLGYPVTYLQPNKNGIITPEALESAITDDTRLVSVMFGNNEIGSIQPIKELCRIAHSHGALFHTDAVQAVGHVKIDVRDLDIDFLSSSAHKFNGPKGIGFLYMKKGVQLRSYADGGAQEGSHRAGTENIPSIVGMSVALQTNCNMLNENIEHVKSLEKELITQLDSLGIEYKRNGGENTLPGIVSLSFPGFDGEAILHRMDLMGISISTGSACDSKNTQISHVLKAIKLDETFARGTVRIALGKENTSDDVNEIVIALSKIVQ